MYLPIRPRAAFALPITATSQPASHPATDQKPIVFVAGATGNVGARVVRLLAEAGCSVRAGSRDPAKCEKQLALGDVHNIEHVRFDVTDRNTMSTALGDASVVVSALGAPLSFGRVDGAGIAALMTLASMRERVSQLVLVSSIGVGRPWAFPAALLNLFGGVLIFKDYSEQVMRRVSRKQGKSYLIVRPGGMERPTDDFSKTHNLLLAPRNSRAGGLVSNLQVAELITAAVLNPEVADGKTVEAVAETDAPKKELSTLLEEAPAD